MDFIIQFFFGQDNIGVGSASRVCDGESQPNDILSIELSANFRAELEAESCRIDVRANSVALCVVLKHDAGRINAGDVEHNIANGLGVSDEIFNGFRLTDCKAETALNNGSEIVRNGERIQALVAVVGQIQCKFNALRCGCADFDRFGELRIYKADGKPRKRYRQGIC